MVIILPEALKLPRSRDSTRRGGPPSEDKRVCFSKLATVTGTRGPPASGGIDHGVSASLSLVGVAKVFDPVDHSRCAEAVAHRAVRVRLEVNHAREGASIAAPAAAVREEVPGLCGARCAVGDREMVPASDEACVCGPRVVRVEPLVGVVVAFGGFDHYEPCAVAFGAGKVDRALVVRDVEALDVGLGEAGADEGDESGELHFAEMYQGRGEDSDCLIDWGNETTALGLFMCLLRSLIPEIRRMSTTSPSLVSQNKRVYRGKLQI